MTVELDDVLPVLRTATSARLDGTVLHVEPPAERESDTPRVAFISDGLILTRAEVAAQGITPDALYRRAIANLAARRGHLRVEQMGGGFGKKSAKVMSLAHEYAAEHILLDGFIDDVERMMPSATFFVPCRGTLRCVVPELVGKERGAARAAYEKAEQAAAAGKAGLKTPVCPFELVRSKIVGQTFALGARFAGTETPYAPATGPRRAITTPKPTKRR